jgi:hypothetical protein
MGRWSYSSRRTVEECKSVTTKFLNKQHYFDGGVLCGDISWNCNGEKTGAISIAVSTINDDEYIRFSYTQPDKTTGDKLTFDYKARIVSTSCNYGGRRWWIICPLGINGHTCNRRVSALYLAGKYFGCRHCHNLTYNSSQDSHKFDRVFLKIGLDPKIGKKYFDEL